jgi:hypothetical protein
MHLKTQDLQGVRVAAEQAMVQAGGSMLIAPASGGWVSTYPSGEATEPEIARQVGAAAGIEHVIVFDIHDSDVLRYWYYRNGSIADSFNSCPDYFGEASDEDMAATGNPDAFTGLLDDRLRAIWGRVIAARMIGGEEVGDGDPLSDFEEERLAKLAELLGINGALGSYVNLMDGEDLENGLSADDMLEVG